MHALNLQGCKQLTEAGPEPLKGLKELKNLNVSLSGWTLVTARGAKPFREALPRCEVFR
jgi:hypothetical protein